MKYELLESPTNPGHFHVEAFDDEGECIKAVFSGPGAEDRATRYCHFMNDFFLRETPPIGFYRIQPGASSGVLHNVKLPLSENAILGSARSGQKTEALKAALFGKGDGINPAKR